MSGYDSCKTDSLVIIASGRTLREQLAVLRKPDFASGMYRIINPNAVKIAGSTQAKV